MNWQKLAIPLAGLFSLAGGYLFTDWYATIPASDPAKYVGRDSCIRCHQPEANQFHGSHHDRAMDLANDQTVLGDFSDQKLSAYGVESRFFSRR